jgi:TonB family protein
VTRQAPFFAAVVIAVAVAAVGVVAGQADPLAARLQSGELPIVPVQAAAAGEVLLSLNVSAAGAVGAVDVLRTTPPFTDAVIAAVRAWRFAPAADEQRRPVASRVLVGEPPKDVAPAATALPMPLTTPIPQYPPNARYPGTVMIETLVAPSGRVVAVTAIRPNPPFDESAMEAARGWLFRPAQGPGLPPNTYAYLIFAFRQPVIGAAPKQ